MIQSGPSIEFTAPPFSPDRARDALASQYSSVRRFTEHLTEGLAAEDMVVQSMPDVSPTKWHLAHTSWFFEQFLLIPHLKGYEPLDPVYLYLFNSYYQQAGERHCRDQRGYISRPTVAEVMNYRRHVDGAILKLIGALEDDDLAEIEPLLTLGVNHEQQHQELLTTDIKHVFSVNPLRPAYRSHGMADDAGVACELTWSGFKGGVHEIGHEGGGFAYDNEKPRHRQFVEPFQLANRLVTNAEFLEFMRDGGYEHSELWLSMGWALIQENGWTEPFYWERNEDDWKVFTLCGMREVGPNEPVAHLNYFEADAYARWAGARLPTEAEWEVAAEGVEVRGNFAEGERFHPAPAWAGEAESALQQMYGDVWQWTASPYTAYPGFRTAAGAVGEYNGKFMCNQYVLRGGSCVTPRGHIRPTYRNFFPPEASWQFTGMRLARDV